MRWQPKCLIPCETASLFYFFTSSILQIAAIIQQDKAPDLNTTISLYQECTVKLFFAGNKHLINIFIWRVALKHP